MPRDFWDSVDERIKKKQPQPIEGEVIQVTASNVLVRPKGSTNVVPCLIDQAQGVSVGKRCIIQWSVPRRAYVILSVYTSQSNGLIAADRPFQNYELYPPPDFGTSDELPGVIVVRWSGIPQYPISFELQWNDDDVEEGAETVTVTRATEYIVPASDPKYFRLRAVAEDYETSSWTSWILGTPGDAVIGAPSDLSYDPADDSDWSPVPDDVEEALDQLATRALGGDFLANGSVPMTNDLDLANHAIHVDDISTPSNPASGTYLLYVKSDGFLYLKNSAGTEYRVGNVIGTDYVRVDGTSAMTDGLESPGVELSASNPAVFSGNPASGHVFIYYGGTSTTGSLYIKFSDGTLVPFIRGDGFGVEITGNLRISGASGIGIVLKQNSTGSSPPTTGGQKYLIYINDDGYLHKADSVSDDLINWQEADQVVYDQTTPADWTTDPDTVEEALDELAARSAADDQTAVEVPYTPIDSGNWSYVGVPTEVKAALDGLAYWLFNLSADQVIYVPTTSGDWVEGAPDDVEEALDKLAARIAGTDTDNQTADEVPYDPTTTGDWVEGAPDDVEEALDKLAARIAGDVTTINEDLIGATRYKTKLVPHQYISFDPEEVFTMADLEGSGTITTIWAAYASDDFSEFRVDVYVDGEVSPSLSFDVGSLGSEFVEDYKDLSSDHVAIEVIANADDSGGFVFKFPIPYEDGCIITITNPHVSGDPALLFTQVFYTDEVTEARRLKSVFIPFRDGTILDELDTFEIADIEDTGTLVLLSMNVQGAIDATFIERDVIFEVDGVPYQTTGWEDTFLRSWGFAAGDSISRPWGYSASNALHPSFGAHGLIDFLTLFGGIKFTETLLITWNNGEGGTDATVGSLVLYYSGQPLPLTGGSGASAFTDLTDTPSSYTGEGGKVVAVKDDETGLEFITAGSGSGNVTSFGTYAASRPGSPSSGDMYYPTDGFFPEIYTGSAWTPWWNGRMLFKPPAAAGWTTRNLGSASLTDDRGTILLTAPGVSGGDVAMAYFTIPAPEFEVRALIEFDWADKPFINAGILLRDSADDPFMLWGRMQTPGSELLLALYSNDDTFNVFWGGPIANAIYAPVPPMRLWLKIRGDGVNLTYSYCLTPDGSTWHEYVIANFDDPVVPDQVGLGIRNDNGAEPPVAYIRVLSWELEDLS